MIIVYNLLKIMLFDFPEKKPSKIQNGFQTYSKDLLSYITAFFSSLKEFIQCVCAKCMYMYLPSILIFEECMHINLRYL